MGYTVPAEHGSDGAGLGLASRRPLVLIAALAVVASVSGCNKASNTSAAAGTLDPAFAASGKTIFRYETFGDETFWTDSLHMNQVIQSAVDPTTALKVGLKVDTDSLPPAVVQGIKNGTVDLKSPATTVVLLKLNAVVGVRGTVTTVNGKDQLTRVGITCALCHSTVDNSFAPGIGKRLDGWPNHDLNPGAIIALSPALTPAQKAVYNSWGPGMYDARYNFDGKSAPQAIPPAYGLRGVASVTYTGDGKEIAYWNRYVAVTQMHGHGSFTDSRLTPPENVQNPPDSVTALLPALQEYQLSLAEAGAGRGVIRSGRRGARQDRVQRRRQMRDVPRRREFHRCAGPLASGVGGRERTGAERWAEPRVTQRDEGVSHDAAPRSVAARALFPQRRRPDARSRRRLVRHEKGSAPDAGAEDRPRSILENALAPRPSFSFQVSALRHRTRPSFSFQVSVLRHRTRPSFSSPTLQLTPMP